jgi:beta-lactamase superfamily II metal-dependent hydrolase
MRAWGWVALIVLGMTLGMAGWAGAEDRVVPTDRVGRSITIRKAPDPQSPSVGQLSKGESGALLGSVPRWYQVELEDGTTGFVSKSFSRIERGLRARRPEELRIHFLGVGGGTCTVVECPGIDAAPMVVDCGSERGIEGDLKAEAATAYVRSLIGADVPNLVLSHADPGHYGWVPLVLGETPVRSIWQGGDPTAYVDAGFTEWMQLQASNGAVVYQAFDASWHNDGQPLGEDLPCGDATVYAMTVNTGFTENSQSLVLMIEYGDVVAVFPGDAEGATERRAMSNYQGAVKATILSASDHGSDTRESNSREWAGATAPTLTVYTAGTEFRYPRCPAVSRYTDHTAFTRTHPARCGESSGYRPEYPTSRAEYMTAVSGTIVVTSNGRSPLIVHCSRGGGCATEIPH